MRTTPRWIPGGVPLAVSPRGLVALREDLGLLESMWQETEAGQGLEEVLQVLVRAHGNDVFTLPDFLAVSVEEDAVRVVGRGAFQVRVVADGGEQVFSAPRVVVWDEACFTGVRDLTVVLEPADVGTTPGLPLRSGLVEASALTWQEPGTGPGPADRGAGEPVPDPVTPVPDPVPGPGAPVTAPAVVAGPVVAAESAVVGGPAVVAEPAVVGVAGVAGVLGGPAVLGVPAPPSPGGAPLDPVPAEPAGRVPATWSAAPVPEPVPAELASLEPAPAGDAGATLRPEDVDPYAGPRWAQGAQETAVPGPEDQVSSLDTPEAPGTPEVPEAPEVFVTPNIPGAFGTPEVSGAPGTPEIYETPEACGTPGAPEVSGVSGAPGAGPDSPGDQPGPGAPSYAPDPAQSAPPVPAAPLPAPPAPVPAAPPAPSAQLAPARPPQDPGPASVEQVEEDYFGHLFDATSLTPHRVEDAAIRQVHCDDVSPLDAVSARHQPQGDPQAPGTGQVPNPPGGASGELPSGVPGGLPDPSGGLPGGSPGGAPAAGGDWRHDGRTVSSAQLRAECQAALPQGGDAAALPGPAGGTGLSGGAPGELLGQAPNPHGGVPGGSPGGVPAAGGDWRHDGCTVSSAQLRAEHQALAALPLPPGTVPDGSAPMVLAAFCPANHPNPVHASRCRQCGAEVTSATGMVRRPPLGLLRASTGATAVLDADVVVGRRPQVTTRSGGPTPHLIAVASPDLGISKSHCAIRVEGWDLTVEDLRSRNGTVLLRPGEAPHRVPEHGSTFLRTGDVIDLGENVTLTIEEAR